MEHVLSICVGLGLAAACGFRVFVPLLVMSIAANQGYLSLGEGFAWIGSWPAIVAFATATALEIAGYYIPWVDNLLDTVSGPAAVVAGTVVTASSIADIDPFLKWSLAIIGGGGIAGAIKASSSLLRGASTLATGGLANPVISTAEAAGSVVLASMAVAAPVIAVLAVGLLMYFSVRVLSRLIGKNRQPA